MQLSQARLKQYRANKGWTQELLATATGLSVRTIQRIESEGNASAESVLALSSALEVLPSALQPDAQVIEAHWTKEKIMYAGLIVTFLFISIITMFNTASSWVHYLDVPILLFTLNFTFLLTTLTFGFAGLKKALWGLKYLFCKDIIGGKPASTLRDIYTCQITYCYSSATMICLIGSIAAIYEINTLELQTDLQFWLPILILPFLYAVLFSECIFRPIKHKLSSHIDN